MSKGLRRTGIRHAQRHPGQFGLTVFGIALGVAVMVAIDLATESSRRAMVLSNEAVLGSTTHQILPSADSMDEALYTKLRRRFPGVKMAPVLEAYVLSAPAAPEPATTTTEDAPDSALRDRYGDTLLLLGIDPFAESAFRNYLDGFQVPSGAGRKGAAVEGGEHSRVLDPKAPDENAGGTQAEGQQPSNVRDLLARLLVEPGTALASATRAERFGYPRNLMIQVNGRVRALHIIAYLESRDELERLGLADVLLVDMATAQEVLDRVGGLSRIDLVVENEAKLSEIRDAIPAGYQLEPAAARSQTARQMTAAFEFNLMMLSLLALLVGMFLIYNTTTFSVLQRRDTIGTLRAMGVTRLEILVQVLTEMSIVGLLGAAVGLGLGYLLAQQLLVLVSQTINDLYFALNVSTVHVPPAVFVKALVVGWATAVLASLLPAMEATHVAPRATFSSSSLEQLSHRIASRIAYVGLGLLGLCLWLSVGGVQGASTAPGAMAQRSMTGGFIALFALVIGFAALTPALTRGFCRILRPLFGLVGGRLAQLALGGISRHLSRSAVAVAALMVALAAALGVAVMVDSFRHSVARWLELSLQADYYLRVPTAGARAAIDPRVIERVRALHGVAELSAGWSQTVRMRVHEHQAPRSVELVAIKMASRSYDSFELLEQVADPWSAYDSSATVFVSESLAWRMGLRAGDEAQLLSARGYQTFRVGAVFRDYGSERGVVIMSRDVFDRYFEAPGYSTLGVYLGPGTSAQDFHAALRNAVRSPQAIVVSPSRAIKKASLEVFDRTFAVTQVLRVLALVVAVVGILNALTALLMERGRETAVLRAQGLTQAQVWWSTVTQTLTMGFMAGLIALPCGIGTATVLIHVVNRRSFGWTMDLTLDPAVLAHTLLIALAAAFIASIYPAYRAATMPIAKALRAD